MEITISEQKIKELIHSALAVRENAYVPYSGFMVGAALLTEDGNVITGCNVENASYGAALCAERNAVGKAVSMGYRNFRAIAIAGGMKDGISDYTYPCGICRQVLAEFAGDTDLIVISARSKTDYKIISLSELLPEAFSAKDISVNI